MNLFSATDDMSQKSRLLSGDDAVGKSGQAWSS